jgi:hypothetical protein
MTIPGYIDRAKHRENLKQKLIAQYAAKVKGTADEGSVFEPPGGWDEFFGPDDPILDSKCQNCGKMVAEVRPFGKDFLQICEECAAKDPAMTAKMSKGFV